MQSAPYVHLFPLYLRPRSRSVFSSFLSLLVIWQNRWRTVVRVTFRYVVPCLKCHTRASLSCWHFNLGTTYLNVTLTNVHQLYNVLQLTNSSATQHDRSFTHWQHGLEVAKTGPRCIRHNVAKVFDVNELVCRITLQHHKYLQEHTHQIITYNIEHNQIHYTTIPSGATVLPVPVPCYQYLSLKLMLLLVTSPTGHSR